MSRKRFAPIRRLHRRLTREAKQKKEKRVGWKRDAFAAVVSSAPLPRLRSGPLCVTPAAEELKTLPRFERLVRNHQPRCAYAAGLWTDDSHKWPDLPKAQLSAVQREGESSVPQSQAFLRHNARRGVWTSARPCCHDPARIPQGLGIARPLRGDDRNGERLTPKPVCTNSRGGTGWVWQRDERRRLDRGVAARAGLPETGEERWGRSLLRLRYYGDGEGHKISPINMDDVLKRRQLRFRLFVLFDLAHDQLNKTVRTRVRRREALDSTHAGQAAIACMADADWTPTEFTFDHCHCQLC
ncbi:hypothetical protein AAFF_G00393170 [Aldrovandia affinis]|uniref:Uncharacterized protein n=1 Tax=Aldrovandia affinis TaxID=143900 RepID=A0AAD7SDX7_9TELE|nr:hypothetical protein AAFF_G00393170 [Aldrovandia affinis]